MTRLTALAGIVGISFAAIFVRLADAAPSTVAFFRTAYAVPFLIVMTRLSGAAVRPRRERLMAFGAGVLLAVDLTLWHVAIDLIGAGLATVLANVQVVWVGLVAWLLLAEKPSRTGFAVVPVVLAGVAMISGLGQDDAFGDDPVLGTIIGLAAGGVYASFLLLFRQSNRSKGRPAAPLLDATAGAVLGSALIGLIDAGFSLEITWPSHGWILALAVVSQTLGWLFITVALPRLAALETSVMLLLQPALTIVWARILFAEDLSALQWTGVAIVMGGVLIAGLRGTVAAPTAAVETGP